MKKSLSCILFGITLNAYAQVGINTDKPAASLDVVGRPTDAAVPDGFIAPRLTRAQLIAKTSYSTNQAGAIVYVSDTSGTTNTATADITTVGYYYFNGTKWEKFTPTVDLRMVGSNNHVTQDAGVGSNGTSSGTGSNNVAIGSDALKSITTGSSNIGIGASSLSNISTASQLVAIGDNALASNTVGLYNTAVGTMALGANTTGEQNTAIGSYALSQSQTSNNNLAIGSDTFKNFVGTGFGGNIAIGPAAGMSLASGTQNILIGTRAFLQTTQGTDNTVIGSDALRYITSAQSNNNTIIGRQAAERLPSGNFNTVIGNQALNAYYGNTRTVSIGYYSGTSASNNTNVIARDNTFIGSSTKISDAITSGTIEYATAIGAGSIVGASNSIILGRVSANVAVDNVGIGTITPSNPLHVTAAANPVKFEGLQADATAANVVVVGADGVLKTALKSSISGASSIWSIQATTNSATTLVDNVYHTGNIAIGTASTDAASTSKLFVKGNIETTGNIITSSSNYADYVFEKYFTGNSTINAKYKFIPLSEVKDFVAKNHHLPGVTPIDEVAKTENGYKVDLTQLSIQQLEKLEELYLHVIEQHEIITLQNQKTEQLQKEIDAQNNRIKALEEKLEKLSK